jgi:hypothetical protein
MVCKLVPDVESPPTHSEPHLLSSCLFPILDASHFFFPTKPCTTHSEPHLQVTHIRIYRDSFLWFYVLALNSFLSIFRRYDNRWALYRLMHTTPPTQYSNHHVMLSPQSYHEPNYTRHNIKKYTTCKWMLSN